MSSQPRDAQHPLPEMSTGSDLIDFFKLNATFDPITASTIETVQNSDRTRREVKIVKWKRTKFLGRGAFGSVWLEQDHKEKNLRAVKEIAKGTTTSPKLDYTRELLALSRLSKVRVENDCKYPSAKLTLG